MRGDAFDRPAPDVKNDRRAMPATTLGPNVEGIASKMRGRFAVELRDDGGIAVDMTTGGFFALDLTAARVCHALLSSPSSSSILQGICEGLGITLQDAERAAVEVWTVLQTDPPRAPRATPLCYERRGDGYVLLDEATAVVQVDQLGETLRFSGRHRFDIIDYLRAVTPKILALQGTPTLHASAVAIGTRVVAFAGASGAGKTTTARALVTSPSELISEDLLLLRAVEGSVTLVRSGEAQVRRWQEDVKQRLTHGGTHEVSCRPLREITSGGADQVLHEIAFLAASHRSSGVFQRERLGGSAALGLLMNHLFLGTEEPSGWRDHLRRARFVAEVVRMVRVAPPAGLDALTAAAPNYRTICAS